MNLKEKTQIIIHSANSITSTIWTIVYNLIEIQDQQLYKEENFKSMEEYVEHYKTQFRFGYRQAQRYIACARELKLDDMKTSLTYSEACMIIQAAPEHRDTLIQKVDDNVIKSPEQLSREINRFKGQIGKDKNDIDEQKLLGIRQGHNICDQIDDYFDTYTEMRDAIKAEILTWNNANQKFLNEVKEIYDLKNKLDLKFTQILV